MNNKKLLNNVINSLLSEEPRWRKEKVDVPHPYMAMTEKYLGQPNVFFTLSDVQKTGIFPKSTESTGPLGIYCYPFTDRIQAQLVNNELPYASDRKFIHFFKAKDPSKTLAISADASPEWGVIPTKDEIIYDYLFKVDGHKRVNSEYDYSTGEYTNKEKEFGLTQLEQEFLGYSKSYSGANDLGYALYKFTASLTNQKAIRWTTMLMKMGFHGVIDLGQGRIYSGEPTQAVFFASSFIEALETIPNYYSPHNRNDKFGALSNYTALRDGEEDGETSYHIAKRRSNPLSANKLKFEMKLKQFLEEKGISEREIWSDERYLTSLYKRIRYEDSAAGVIFQKVSIDTLLRALPDFGELEIKFATMVLRKFSKEQLNILMPGQITDFDPTVLTQKFKNDFAGLLAFIEKHNLTRLINRFPKETQAEIFKNSKNPRMKKMAAMHLAAESEYYDLIIQDPDEEIRLVAIDSVPRDGLVEMFFSDPSERVRNAILPKLPVEAASDPRFDEETALKIFNNYIKYAGYYQGDDVIAAKLSSAAKTRQNPHDFLIKVLKTAKRHGLILNFKSQMTQEEIIEFAHDQKDPFLFSEFVKELPAEIVIELLGKKESFKMYPLDFIRFLGIKYGPFFIGDKDPNVRAAIATIAAQPELEILIKDESRHVREMAARRLDNVELLKKIATEDPDYYVKNSAQSRLSYLAQPKW